MSDLEQRLASLEARLRHLEDEQEITKLILSYAPLVDSGCDQQVAGLWEEDGVYDVDEIFMQGHEQLSAMVRSPMHQTWISGGCAHFAGPPHITLDGDEATAVCYTMMIVNTPDGFTVRRATANRWELRRTPAGWRAVRRVNRVLDGREESPDLLASAFPGAVRHRP